MAEFVYLTPDEYRALRERIDRTESSTTHWKSETLRLRARLAEVETNLSEERDHAAEGWERARHLQGLLQAAERGESKQIRRAEAAEARLAAIEKLCEDGTIRDNWTAIQVRAAAQGETAQHYDTEDAHGNPVCVCPDINGEYDGG